VNVSQTYVKKTGTSAFSSGLKIIIYKKEMSWGKVVLRTFGKLDQNSSPMPNALTLNNKVQLDYFCSSIR